MAKERVQNDLSISEVFFKVAELLDRATAQVFFNRSLIALTFPPISRCSRNDGWFDPGWTQGTLVT